jgi:hypothetical protein
MAKKSINKKQYPLKMDTPLWTRLENRAIDDKRSVNQTIILAIEKLLES